MEKFLSKHDDLILYEEVFHARAEAITPGEVHPGKYKHGDRWKFANTLVNLYGYEEGLRYLKVVCSNTPSTNWLAFVILPVITKKPD